MIGPCHRGVVVAMRESDGFGFVKPDPCAGLRPMDVFFHFVTSLAPETDIETIYVRSAVEFHIVDGRDGKKRATGLRLAVAHDPTASLRPVFGLSPAGGLGPLSAPLSVSQMPGGKLSSGSGGGSNGWPGGGGMGIGAGVGGMSANGRMAGDMGGDAGGNGRCGGRRGGGGGGGGIRRGGGGGSSMAWCGGGGGGGILDTQRQQQDTMAEKGRALTADGRIDVNPLLVLLRAPSQKEIQRLFDDCFSRRADMRLPHERVTELARKLRCDNAEEASSC